MRTALHKRVQKALVFVVACGMLAGVLIWSKLRLATDIPRSALADPEDGAGASGRDGDAPGAAED